MNRIHDLLSTWVAAYPVIAVLGTFAVGLVLGFFIRSKLGGKKKDH